MKKVAYICIPFLMAVLLHSCDQLPEELFEKKVSLTKNGWVDIELDIPASGVIEFPLSAVVSGTSENDRDIKVKLAVDGDALAEYNYEKYRNDTELYYTGVPTDALILPEELVIKSGEETGIAELKIDMSKLTDLYADYVLPIKIMSTSDYEPNMDCNTALYHIVFANSFSGTYSASMNVVKVRTNGSSNESDKTTVGSKTLYAISSDECFFYSGTYDRDTKGRNKAIVTIKTTDVVADAPVYTKGVVLDTPIEELDIQYWYNKYDSVSTVNYSLANNPNDNRYYIQTTMFDLSYTFMDLGKETPERYRMVGKMSKVETDILKEDIDW